MGTIINNTTKTIGRIALKTIGAIRVKTKTDNNKQIYNTFLKENNITQSRTGDLSFTRHYQGYETKIKIPSEHIGKKSAIEKFIKLIDDNLNTIDNPSPKKRTTIENGKMYHQGIRKAYFTEYRLPNGIESEPIPVTITYNESYKERVK